MLEQPWSWARLLRNSGADTQKTAEQSKTVQDEVDRLSELVQILAIEEAQREQKLNHLRARDGKDLENLELRLRLGLSEKLRYLLPPRSE